MNNFVVGLDIGSQTIKAAIAEIKKDGKLKLVKVIKTPSGGIRRGAVDDAAEATRSLNYVIGEIKKISKSAVKNIYVGVGTHDIKVQNSRGIVAVSRADYEIHQDDIDRVIEASQAVNLPLNRLILHAITQEYVVDGVGDIRDPLGMVGNRLEVNSLIIDAFAPAVKNLTRCLEVVGGEISGIAFSPIAAVRSVLTKSQKELGAVLIDIGFGKTGMSVYEENKLIHSAVFPIGSGNVTNDLAIGMKTGIATAEMIKFSFGTALAKEVPPREMVDLRKIDPAARGFVARRFIAEIIEVRLAEILEFVDNELKRLNKSRKLPAGAVLVGGGAKIPALTELAKQELHLSAQIGLSDISSLDLASGDLRSQIEDPEYAIAIGLIMIAGDQLREKNPMAAKKGGWFKKLMKYFIP
jgi:cell division protein FtsA